MWFLSKKCPGASKGKQRRLLLKMFILVVLYNRVRLHLHVTVFVPDVHVHVQSHHFFLSNSYSVSTIACWTVQDKLFDCAQGRCGVDDGTSLTTDRRHKLRSNNQLNLIDEVCSTATLWYTVTCTYCWTLMHIATHTYTLMYETNVHTCTVTYCENLLHIAIRGYTLSMVHSLWSIRLSRAVK